MIEILDSKEPFANVKNLLINGYQGVIFKQDQDFPKNDWINCICQDMLTEIKKSSVTSPSIYPSTGRTLKVPQDFDALSIDLNGNDYWVLDKILKYFKPKLIVAEFNPAKEGSVAIQFNPNFKWSGDDYYGFSFEAGKRLAERYGYYIIFQNDNVNLYMVDSKYVKAEQIPVVTHLKTSPFAKNTTGVWVSV